MAPIQFQVVDAFIKWSFSGYKGSFESFVNKSNPTKQAWRGLLFTFVLLVLVILILRFL